MVLRKNLIMVNIIPNHNNTSNSK